MSTIVKFTEAPKYEEVALIGKTIESTFLAGTFDREQIVRRYLTEAEGFDGKSEIIVNGADKYGILTVKPDTLDVYVELMGGKKSLASWKFAGFTADSIENEGCVDLFVPSTDDVANKGRSLRACAEAMSAATPEAANLWRVVTSDGKRVFIRAYSPVDKKGRVDDSTEIAG